jgi:hypothetical protein
MVELWADVMAGVIALGFLGIVAAVRACSKDGGPPFVTFSFSICGRRFRCPIVLLTQAFGGE